MKRILLMMISVVGLSACSPNTQKQTSDLQQQVTKLKQYFADLRQQMKQQNARAQIAQANGDKIAAVEKQVEKTVPQPTNVAVTGPSVNILLMDEYGRVPHCFKGVRVADIVQSGKLTHFLFNGKPIDWNQKVVFSYTYTDNDPPITGAIVWTPKIAGEACKVINLPPSSVYQDTDGTIRYEDGAGRYPCAPKGAGYITAQSVLPTQQ